MEAATIKKKTIKERFMDALIGLGMSLILVIITSVIGYYGFVRETSGATGIRLNQCETRLDKIEAACTAEVAKDAQYKEDEGIVLNQILNKLDTVLTNQIKQGKFNERLVEGNKLLARSLQDIFGLQQQNSPNH